jgi:hypothetical protein
MVGFNLKPTDGVEAVPPISLTPRTASPQFTNGVESIYPLNELQRLFFSPG